VVMTRRFGAAGGAANARPAKTERSLVAAHQHTARLRRRAVLVTPPSPE
jgi:hypothetical protein